MSRGRWVANSESLAKEAFAVLIEGRPQSRKYTKKQLSGMLSNPDIYITFLKLCVEYDKTSDLSDLRDGLHIVVKAIGPSSVARKACVSRVSLYRMLSKGGNPRIRSLIGLFTALGLRFWLVDEGFSQRGDSFVRPKDEIVHGIRISRGRRIPRRYSNNNYWGD